MSGAEWSIQPKCAGTQCAGCGDQFRGCRCTPATIREQLAADRREMSERLAASSSRANRAIAILQGPSRIEYEFVDPDNHDAEKAIEAAIAILRGEP